MRIVLAYAGSLAGSAAIVWLRERQGAEVVTATLDLGQGRVLEAVRDRALALGALRAHVLDARDVFAQEFVVPALRADALHDGRVPMALALSRPLIARTLVEMAAIEKAGAVAHTGRVTGDPSAPGASPLDRLLCSLAPGLPVLTPARDWTLGPDDLAAFARRHGLPSTSDDARPVESNLWGRSQPLDAAGPLDRTRAQGPWPGEPAFVDISFSRGIPTALNGVALPLLELVASLGTLASTHGVGPVRTAAVTCDAPAALLLHAAHRDLTRAVCPGTVGPFADAATAAYIDAVEQARWFSPLREGLDAFFGVAQAAVSGHVRLRLFRGSYSTVTTEPTPPSPPPAMPSVAPSHAQH